MASNDDDVTKLVNAVVLSTLALEATAKWDDVTHHFIDNPGSLAALEISQEELDQVSRVARKLIDRAHDRKNNLARVASQALAPGPTPQHSAFEMMWEAVQAAKRPKSSEDQDPGAPSA